MKQKSTNPGFYGWWLLPILCLVYSIPIGFALYGPPVIYQFMQKELGWQRGEVNLGYSVAGITFGMAAMMVPQLINRLGLRKTLVVGAIVTASSAVFMAIFGYIYPVYILLCLFTGLGLCFGSVVPIQMLVLLWFNVHRALAMGLVLGGGAIGGFIYPQIINACIVNLGGDWRTGWYVVGLACFLGAVVALLAVKNRPDDLGQYPDGLSPAKAQVLAQQVNHRSVTTYRTPTDWKFSDALKTRAFWIIVVSIAAIFFLWQTILTQTPAHLRDRGFSPSDPSIIYQPSFIYGLIVACSIVGRLSISILGERIEPRFLIAIAGTSLLIGGLFFWLASRENLWAAYLFPVFTGVGFGATYICQPLIVGNYYGLRPFPDLSRITHPVGSIFQYMAPSFAGFLYDMNGTYAVAVIVACSAALIGTILMLFCQPPTPRNGTTP